MELTDAARQLIAAIDDEGRNPDFHRKQVERLQYDWPTLWNAIEAVRDAVT